MKVVLLIFILVPIFIFQYTIIVDILEHATKSKGSTSSGTVSHWSPYGNGRIQRTSYRVSK